MKVLAGAVPPDAGGDQHRRGARDLRGPIAARAAGIEMAYADFALVPHLTLTQNVFLGREMLSHRWACRLDGRRWARVRASCSRPRPAGSVGHLPVRALSGGQQQAVAIARATGFAARLVIMDEPTANLGAPAIAKVRETILGLKSQGVAVILISHRLEDVFAVADSVQVMKRGEVAGCGAWPTTTADRSWHDHHRSRFGTQRRGRMTPRRRRPTIIDVAQAAGVSVGTVSHVLNDTRQGAAGDAGLVEAADPAARLPPECSARP